MFVEALAGLFEVLQHIAFDGLHSINVLPAQGLYQAKYKSAMTSMRENDADVKRMVVVGLHVGKLSPQTLVGHNLGIAREA